MKPLGGENYTVRPFKTHKTQIYQYTYQGGGNPSQLTIDYAKVPPSSSGWAWYDEDEPVNPSGIFERSLHAGVSHLFYSPESNWNTGGATTKGWTPTGDVYVLSLAQSSFGEKITPTTFLIEAPLTSTASLFDNGLGQLVSSENTSSVVGNVFYELGIAVVAKSSSSFSSSIVVHDGVYLTVGSQVEVTFDATQTIYEHQIMCVLEEGEFNFSINPSMYSTSSIDGAFKPIDKFASGTLQPYLTTVGMYTNLGELVAVAKFPRPIKRAVESQQTVIVRFDA